MDQMNRTGQIPGGGGQNVTVYESHTYNINAPSLDARDFDGIVADKIIPALDKQRRRRAWNPQEAIA